MSQEKADRSIEDKNVRLEQAGSAPRAKASSTIEPPRPDEIPQIIDLTDREKVTHWDTEIQRQHRERQDTLDRNEDTEGSGE